MFWKLTFKDSDTLRKFQLQEINVTLNKLFFFLSIQVYPHSIITICRFSIMSYTFISEQKISECLDTMQLNINSEINLVLTGSMDFAERSSVT